MNAVTYTDLKQNLKTYMDKVVQNSDPLIVTRKNIGNVVLISIDEYNSLIETNYLLSNEANAEHLKKSIAQHKSGKVVARNVSGDESRADLAKTMSALVQRLSEQYAQNVDSEAKKIWEEGVRQLADQEISGATVYKTIIQYNSENNRYKIYSLMVLSPDLLKNALALASSRQEEFELRVKKDDMMKKLDEGVADYEAKYKK